MCECKELIDKVYVINDLFGVLLVMIVNMINLVILENIKIIQIVNKLVEECIKSIDEVEITQAENEHKNECSSCTCTLYCFQHSLQSVLELLLILFILIGV